jgi:hypothetical protein
VPEYLGCNSRRIFDREGWLERALLWPFLSAAAILLKSRMPPAPFAEDPREEQDRFSYPGAIVEVDPGDREALSTVPNLRQVQTG